MTDSTIGVAEPGTPTKQLQSYQNTVSGQSVQAEGVVQVDLNGVPVPRGTKADPVVIGGLFSDGSSVVVPQVTSGTPASNANGMVVRSVGSQSVVGTVTANQGTPNQVAANSWYVLAHGDSISTPGTHIQLEIDDQTFLGTRSLIVGSLGSAGQYLQQDANNNLKVAQQGTATVSQNLLGASDKPDITANQSGILQTSNDVDRRLQERLTMLAESAALNSLIASDNGPGARNYQELR
jgi:hypothetical protein